MKSVSTFHTRCFAVAEQAAAAGATVVAVDVAAVEFDSSTVDLAVVAMKSVATDVTLPAVHWHFSVLLGPVPQVALRVLAECFSAEAAAGSAAAARGSVLQVRLLSKYR